jgi:hypothetical protein
VLDRKTVSADAKGYRRLLTFGRQHAAQLWAIEGTGSFGAGLTAVLLASGERVVEVDRPQRPARRTGAKATTSTRSVPLVRPLQVSVTQDLLVHANALPAVG